MLKIYHAGPGANSLKCLIPLRRHHHPIDRHQRIPGGRLSRGTARPGFSATDPANATRKIVLALDKVEDQLSRTPWLAGDSYTLADINFFAHCGQYANRMFPDLAGGKKRP